MTRVDDFSSWLMLIHVHVKKHISICLKCEAALDRAKELCK